MSAEPSSNVGGGSTTSPADEILARDLANAVAEAGALALEMSRSGVKSWNKDNNSPVTEADLAVDRFLHHALLSLAPDCGWLSEETTDDPIRLSHRRLWVVDPIDGTRGFLKGAPDWAVSVALVEAGRPILAALFAPVSGEMFTAMAGRGAWRNGTLLQAGRRTELPGATAAGPQDAIKALARSEAIQPLPRGHSLALRITRVATGEVDIALSRADSHDWDLAAADLLAEEAGARLTTYDAAPLVYNAVEPRHAPLICAGASLHDAALAAARSLWPAAAPTPLVKSHSDRP